MTTKSFLYKSFATLALLAVTATAAWGQVRQNKYTTEVGANSVYKTYNASNRFSNARNASDGNTDSYAMATSRSSAYLTYSIPNNRSSIKLLRIVSQNGQYRPTSVSVSTSNSSSGRFREVVSNAQLSFSEDVASVEVNGSDLSQYVRLTFNFASNSGRIYEVYFYDGEPEATIRHKDPKWFDLAETLGLDHSSLGSFSTQRRFEAEMSGQTEQMQAAHTYIDTIYVHKGQSIQLIVPTRKDDNSQSAGTYQRWYSYRTGKTFETEDHGDAYDLLTPSRNGTFYRLENGYVGFPLSDNYLNEVDFYYPTDAEFAEMFPSASGAANIDNDWYVVACDLSAYTDFTENFDTKGNNGEDYTLQECRNDFRNGYWEPTLAVRAIYYIVGVDDRQNVNDSWNNGHGRLKTSDYNDLDGTSGTKYLEEYDITFPSHHVSNFSYELVSLSKDARSYAIPDAVRKNNDGTVTRLDNDVLDVSVGPNDPIELVTTSVSGRNRVIQFKKRGASGRDPWTIDDGETATITVTKSFTRNERTETYNIARYKLTFLEESNPLTQVEIANIEAGSPLEYRSTRWLRENRDSLTALTFDYPQSVANMHGQSKYFHFPLDWSYSSYAFFDGGNTRDYMVDVAKLNGWYPLWDFYGLTNDYVGYSDQTNGGDHIGTGRRPVAPSNDGKPANGFFIYVDASDRPGVLARLPFDEKLCSGSELFVTAWMKSAGQRGQDSDDAALLFTIMGVDSLEDGTVNYTPLYRHSSGQIRATTWLNGTGNVNNGNTKADGKGTQTNNWFQIYFSFINDNERARDFDSYMLQVENNCASTQGGDFYLDDIRVYIAQPTAHVLQKEFACSGERTLLRASLDWEQLCERLGDEPEQTATGLDYRRIDYCFIDETLFNHLMEGHTSSDFDALRAALDSAAVLIGRGAADDEGRDYNQKIASMHWDQCFTSNKEYDLTGRNLAIDNVIPTESYNAHFYRLGDAEHQNRQLSVDFYAAMTPNRPYIMFMLDEKLDDSGTSQTNTFEDFASYFYDACAMKSRFYVEGQTLIKINGQVAMPETDFCLGQVFDFSAQLRVPELDENGDIQLDPETGQQIYKPLDAEVYFDWFFGTEQEYTKAHDEDGMGGQSLQSALLSLRNIAAYRDIDETNFSTVVPVAADPGTHDGLTQEQINVIKYYLDQPGATGGLNDMLVLHRKTLDITILADGTELVLSPIPINKPSDMDDAEWERICWEYVPLEFNASAAAPGLRAGFDNTEYPENFNPALRIGLAQIEKAKYVTGSGSSTSRVKISLRDAQYASEGVDHIGLVRPDGGDVDYTNIFLVATDDPAYDSYLDPQGGFEQHYLPIGKLVNLYATEGGEDNAAYVQFNLSQQTLADNRTFQFTPREGYTYTFSINFAERSDRLEAAGEMFTSCAGTFPIDMKVVPENLVWQGGEGGALKNWNNDNNWKRADATDLHAEGTNYTSNQQNGTNNGFVPMLFSNVVMPKDSRAHLYMAGYNQGGGVGGSLTPEGEAPEGMEKPTDNIWYDLMVYDGDPEGGQQNLLTTQRYRVNICNYIHFNDGAQMLHAEQLIYTKASMDVPVPTKQWTLVSTPLRGVVAGDWYTNTDGKQTGEELFTDITFDATKHNRLNPAVYQRSWAGSATIVENGSANTPVSFGALWSSAYNDAYVPYTAGGGFSITATQPQGNDGTLTFRLPKADDSYDVSTGSLDRTGEGKLLVSGLLDRSDPLNLVRNENVTATLTPSYDKSYMIVGNPFMAPLNLQAFFDANDNLEPEYWSETELGPVAGSNAGGQWTSTDGSQTISPYGAFFVRKTSAEASDVVTFTADMQASADETAGTATTNALTITATADGKRSGAVLAYDDAAADAFSEGEDAQLITDLTGNGTVAPLAYTVAGTTAASINVVSTTRRIPMGVFAADDEVTTLSFSGTATLRNPRLYDAALQTETPLTDATTLSVSGASHGRYFIISDGAAPTGISGVDGDGATELSVYSVTSGEVIVAASAPIGLVNVYSAGGALLKSVDAAGAKVCTVSGLPADVVVVRVALPGATEARKLKVKR